MTEDIKTLLAAKLVLEKLITRSLSMKWADQASRWSVVFFANSLSIMYQDPLGWEALEWTCRVLRWWIIKRPRSPPLWQTHFTCKGVHTQVHFCRRACAYTHLRSCKRHRLDFNLTCTHQYLRWDSLTPFFRGFWQHPGRALYSLLSTLFISTPQRARIQVRAAAVHSDGARKLKVS